MHLWRKLEWGKLEHKLSLNLFLLRFGIGALVLGAVIVLIYLLLPCLFGDIDCGDNGQCENMFNDYSCSCGQGALKMDNSSQSKCITDYCYDIDCKRGVCEASANDYSCECDSG